MPKTVSGVSCFEAYDIGSHWLHTNGVDPVAVVDVSRIWLHPDSSSSISGSNNACFILALRLHLRLSRPGTALGQAVCPTQRLQERQNNFRNRDNHGAAAGVTLRRA